jgi:hypothetical protein
VKVDNVKTSFPHPLSHATEMGYGPFAVNNVPEREREREREGNERERKGMRKRERERDEEDDKTEGMKATKRTRLEKSLSLPSHSFLLAVRYFMEETKLEARS